MYNVHVGNALCGMASLTGQTLYPLLYMYIESLASEARLYQSHRHASASLYVSCTDALTSAFVNLRVRMSHLFIVR